MAETTRTTSSAVRRPVRAKPAEEPEAVRSGLRWKRTGRLIIMIVTVMLITVLFPRQAVVESQFRIGLIWLGDTVRAPFAFPLYKDESAYRREVASALASTMPVFVPAKIRFADVADSIGSAFERFAGASSRPMGMSARSWAYLQSLPGETVRRTRLAAIAASLNAALKEPYRAGIISLRKSSVPRQIAIRRGEAMQETVPVSMLYDSIQVIQYAEETLARQFSTDESILAIETLTSKMRPTYLFSSALTEEARSNAEAGVSRSHGIVSLGEIIVGPGDQVSDEVHAKMSSLQRSRGLHEEPLQTWRQALGNLSYVLIMLTLCGMYLYYFRPRILRDNLQLGIICTSLVLVTLLGWLSVELKMSLPVEFLIPIPLFSMLLAILFDSRTAFYLTVISCFIVAGVRGNDYTVAIACLVAGVLAAYTVRDIKNRTQLFRSIGFALLGYVLAIAAMGLQQGTPLSELATRFGFAAINATISPVLTFGALLLIETVFGVATDLKLLEYDNLNHPVLRALADNAPGTYQHTLSIAQLTERAAAAIGANALLAKVGAYYHDIGKIAKPEYFVENQMHMGNKHDRISPEQSARIIRDHVLDGIKLAVEYKLPQRIIDFIPMHHGTTSIQYFLDKARQKDPDADPAQFHYPGPVPNSRETAILMLADATEAITRLLSDPTPQQIESAVEGVIRKRIDEKQLDQCNLTLADLAGIKDAFVKNLIGVSHTRIKYDADKDDETENVPQAHPPFSDDAFGNRETTGGETGPIG